MEFDKTKRIGEVDETATGKSGQGKSSSHAGQATSSEVEKNKELWTQGTMPKTERTELPPEIQKERNRDLFSK